MLLRCYFLNCCGPGYWITKLFRTTWMINDQTLSEEMWGSPLGKETKLNMYTVFGISILALSDLFLDYFLAFNHVSSKEMLLHLKY